ncbi:uncharacterized protein CLUP02_09474 [Colletotrichum lupini]|uniref:Uncharacterized protein n=1 Tax=Colletotrichum lupini TaxID=145971 RepID=A0A9Q8WHM4_9PEZI|nr:uncharacterized protein CLUP02_09474 [Colletotrichum lupini]UQC83978.1 hypothetical protein CLUP02_09474 [Colletotrichum lupini]
MMSTGCDAMPTPSGSPCEVLRQVERLGGAQTMIDRVDLATGSTTPFYVLHSNKENKTVAVLHADPRAQASELTAAELGSWPHIRTRCTCPRATRRSYPNSTARIAKLIAKYHSLSSKIDVILRGVPIKMKTNTMGNTHRFDHHGISYSWGVSNLSMSMNTMCLKDAGGNLLATWKRYPEGRLSGMIGQSAPTFEVYVPPQSIDMDMVIVTGSAAVEYWLKYKKDSYAAVGEAFGAV